MTRLLPPRTCSPSRRVAGSTPCLPIRHGEFKNRTGKVAPEHRRLHRYGTMTLPEIKALPVAEIVEEPAHLYLWVPNACCRRASRCCAAWGFAYKTTLVWHKVRKDGGSDGRGVGFYFRNVTESVLFGVRGKNARTLAPGRRQINLIATPKARAQPQARRALPDHRGLQPRTVPRALRARQPARLDELGHEVDRPELPIAAE